ncbi:hypothetical protein I316_00971 [Kwoniella heveanensis BCC8398]|uniref:Uncharacterized protein n=1 Tax=Kwoniella heveanensis BCC8398 TaxID=1296120 RepID=A0A1B9H1B1_9TREE|nr:hypothetical protein I316_00971 [Kwoniella heveanensis BCC8398]
MTPSDRAHLTAANFAAEPDAMLSSYIQDDPNFLERLSEIKKGTDPEAGGWGRFGDPGGVEASERLLSYIEKHCQTDAQGWTEVDLGPPSSSTEAQKSDSADHDRERMRSMGLSQQESSKNTTRFVSSSDRPSLSPDASSQKESEIERSNSSRGLEIIPASLQPPPSAHVKNGRQCVAGSSPHGVWRARGGNHPVI